MTDKQQPPEDPEEDRLEIEDLAPKTDESGGPKGGDRCNCMARCAPTKMHH